MVTEEIIEFRQVNGTPFNQPIAQEKLYPSTHVFIVWNHKIDRILTFGQNVIQSY